MARKLRDWESGRVIVYDNSACSGCRTCETVCALSHEGVANPKYARIEVTRHIFDGIASDIATCAQCESANCAKACPKDAISIDPATKAKVVDEGLCIGCGICVKACVVAPPRVMVDPQRKKAFKCDLCGGTPKCVELCPMGALAYREVE